MKLTIETLRRTTPLFHADDNVIIEVTNGDIIYDDGGAGVLCRDATTLRVRKKIFGDVKPLPYTFYWLHRGGEVVRKGQTDANGVADISGLTEARYEIELDFITTSC